MDGPSGNQPGIDDTSWRCDLVIGDRFRLLRRLGKGGMGSVWVAEHKTLGIEVAVKFIDRDLLRSKDARSRFAQEAMAAARIKSPHVVNIIDYGTDDTGRPYIAMEKLEGEDLACRLEREGRLSVEDTTGLIAQTCRGLSKAHAAGIVHRDLKPENLFLCEDDGGFLVKVLDFGIAKTHLALDTCHKTASGAVLGTPSYMSPEQARGESSIDFRTDLYSLATVAYRALVGELPFPDDNLHSLLFGLVARQPDPPSVRCPELTDKFDDWFSRGLAKSPDARFASAREMAESFVALCYPSGPMRDKWAVTGSDLHPYQAVSEESAARDAPVEIHDSRPEKKRKGETGADEIKSVPVVPIVVHDEEDEDDDETIVEIEPPFSMSEYQTDRLVELSPSVEGVEEPARVHETDSSEATDGIESQSNRVLSTFGSTAVSTDVESKSRVRRPVLALVFGVTLFGASAGIAFALYGSGADPQEPSAVVAAASSRHESPRHVHAPEVSASAAPRAEDSLVPLEVTVEPAYATVFIDGQRVDARPVVVSFEAKGEHHSVRMEAEGYQPKSFEVFEGVQTGMRVTLDAARPSRSHIHGGKKVEADRKSPPAEEPPPTEETQPVDASPGGDSPPMEDSARHEDEASPPPDNARDRIKDLDTSNPWGR